MSFSTGISQILAVGYTSFVTHEDLSALSLHENFLVAKSIALTTETWVEDPLAIFVSEDFWCYCKKADIYPSVGPRFYH